MIFAYQILFVYFVIRVISGQTDEKWRQAALDKHNEYRKTHSADPLTMCEECCDVSQSYADYLASRDVFTRKKKLVHSMEPGFGENLYWSFSSNREATMDPGTAVKSWYDEIKDYDFSKPGLHSATGHFTQMVWKRTKQACVSFQKKIVGRSVEYFVVAEYRPQGNIFGKFPENVQASATSIAGYFWMCFVTTLTLTILARHR